MATEVTDKAAIVVVDVDDNAEAKVEKVYTCKFCDRRFYNWQACGGHQNAHRREHAAIRQLQIASEFLAMPPTQPQPLPSFVPANHHQSFMYLQQPRPSFFGPPPCVPSHLNHYHNFIQTPLPTRFQPYIHRGANHRSSVAFSPSNMNANVGNGYSYQFGDGTRRGEELRRNNRHHEHGSTSRIGSTTGAVTMERATSSNLMSNNGSVGSGNHIVLEDSENDLDLSLHL